MKIPLRNWLIPQHFSIFFLELSFVMDTFNSTHFYRLNLCNAFNKTIPTHAHRYAYICMHVAFTKYWRGSRKRNRKNAETLSSNQPTIKPNNWQIICICTMNCYVTAAQWTNNIHTQRTYVKYETTIKQYIEKMQRYNWSPPRIIRQQNVRAQASLRCWIIHWFNFCKWITIKPERQQIQIEAGKNRYNLCESWNMLNICLLIFEICIQLNVILASLVYLYLALFRHPWLVDSVLCNGQFKLSPKTI